MLPILFLMKDQIYKIALTKIPKVGNKIGMRLLQHFGTAESVFKATKKELIDIFGVSDQRVSAIKSGKGLIAAEKELKYLEKTGSKAFFITDDNYPRRLKEIADPPLVAYFKGNCNLDTDKVVAIVGTRKPTSYGIGMCEKLIDDLKEYHPLIISGLAFGIDAHAHKNAMKNELSTLGVVAHGLSEIYPARHRNLSRKMLDQGGLFTEFTHNIKAEKEFFPMRNRLVAGLCDALVVVQTAARGGSMISADLANAYFKDVFAFPGRSGDHYSAGCNLLIKSNKAQLIESGNDLASGMGWNQAKPLATQIQLFETLDEAEQKVVEALQSKEELNIDQLSISCKMTNSEISAVLLQLEFKGLIMSSPGKIFSLVR